MLILKSPIPNAKITVPFGKDFSKHPIKSKYYKLFNNKHPGVDFAVPVNTPVLASFEGIVVRKEFHPGMGNVIGIRNGNIVALYAHLNRIHVKRGQIIKQGQKIGLSGNTGKALIVPHLHFELRDITKPHLAQMVFEPKFEQPLNNWMTSFIYTVNNTNTVKTLVKLSKLFFGNEHYANLIKKANHLPYKLDEVLPHGLPIKIPNFDIT